MTSILTAPYEIRDFIAGEWTGTASSPRHNPARPDDLVSLAVWGDEHTVADAVAAAKAAQPDWAGRTGPARGAVLIAAGELLARRAHEVAVDLVREEGKTLAEATAEVQRAAEVLHFYGSACWHADGQTFPSAGAGTHLFTKREPLGVVAVITPWNFPIAIPTWKIAPALAMGNSVVAKPAQLTPVSMRHLVACLTEAGLPAGVLNLVHGAGGTVGEALVSHPDIAAVSFTGSSLVGRRIEQLTAGRQVRVQLEMGGKNPLVVLDDADPAEAARIAAAGGFGLTGQACTATGRILVTTGVYDAFVDAFRSTAAGYTPGDGLNRATRMGPVVSRSQLTTDQEYLATALAEGNEVHLGKAPKADGLFQPPAVVTNVSPTDTIAREEIFGPIVAVLAVSDLDEAISVANELPYGLSAGLVSNDLRAVHRFVERIEAGVVKINRSTSGLDLNVPFGGIKDSSSNTYREQGLGALEFFSWTKTIYLGHGPA
ncbi:aldehyde dehydrogenase family protein [Streptomyces sp. NPDC005708]|uniref:aldehyde dehydrogenase family protein n=1 Tax=Streptomyces sp. NPDC005708 TaxID=3154564 RepID=UPI00340CB540